MTPILDKQIDRRLAWHGTDLTRDRIAFDLTPRHVAAIEAVMARIIDKPLTDISPQECRHPALDDDLAGILAEVQNGRGIVLVRGFPVAGYTLEQTEKMDWAINTHFGEIVPQNALGERLRRVQNEPRAEGERVASGTKSRDDLAMHTDNAEIFTLMCVRQARSGGNTQFTSALAIHNEMLEKRPDLLEILYRGFPWHRRGEQRDDQPEITPFDVPVFSNVDGYVSVQIAFGSIHAAMLTMGRELTAKEREALDMLRDLTERFQFQNRFEPGEMAVINNLTMFHARSEYVDFDEPEKRRVLLRMWMAAARDRRPVVPEIWYMSRKNGGPGVDHVPDRKVASNEYYGVPETINNVIKQAQARDKTKLS